MTQSTWKRRAGTLLAALVFTLVVLPGAASSQTAPNQAAVFQQIDTLGRVPDDARAIFGDVIVPRQFFEGNPSGDPAGRYYTAGTLIHFPEVRQLWQVWLFTRADFTKATAVAVRDPETLKIKKTFILETWMARGTATAGYAGEWMHTVDPGKRAFVAMDPGTGALHVNEIDFVTHKATLHSNFLFGGAQAQFVGLRLGSITYDPFDNSLIGLAGGPSSLNAANTNTYIFKKNLTTGGTEGPRPLNSCTGPLPSVDSSRTYSVPILPTQAALFVPCHRLGMAGAVVRVARDNAFGADPNEQAVVGPVYVESVLADTTSGRLFLVTTKGEIWAFDTNTMSFVGVVSAAASGPSGVNVGVGIDRESGRVFFQSASYGLGVVEGRFFPIPQAITAASIRAEGQEKLWSDSRTGKLFVLEGMLGEKRQAYKIYKLGPAPTPPAEPDPDRSTIDRDEERGVTQSRYFASGSGYGFRVILANGVATIAPQPTAGVLAPGAEVMVQNLYSKCGFTDRELLAGRVQKAEYDTGSTAASAVAFDVDGRTKQDLERPSRCDFAINDGSNERFSGIFSTFQPAAEYDEGPGWKRDNAECTSFDGGEPSEDVGDDEEGNTDGVPLGKSRVECPLPGGVLRASAESSTEGAVAVGKAATDVTVRKTAKGVLSEVTSVARNIEIGGVIRIEEVRSVATSLANGRPSKTGDMSTHTIEMTGVSIGGDPICPAECNDIGATIDRLNRFGAGRVQFRVASGIDEKLRTGTKKGALTAVQKSTQRQASDQALVGDFTTDVAALEMIVYNDNTEWGRARQLYQFAGVSSVAGYSIALDFSAMQFDDPPSFDEPLDDLGADGSFDDDLGGPAPTSFTEPLPPIDEATGRTIGNPGGPIEGENPFTRAVLAVGRGLRLFFTSPRHALLLFTAWSLFSLPGVLSRRRRLLAAVRSL
ncbi:MAG TPA: hypothetical protein VF230_16120 [Acidimicrobiales bacterium]